MALHTTTAPEAIVASAGSLAGFSVTCSCGFEVRTSLSAMFAETDAREHVAYMAAKAQGPKALRAFVLRGVR